MIATTMSDKKYQNNIRVVIRPAFTVTESLLFLAFDSIVTLFSPPVIVIAGVGHYGTLPSTKTMGNISEHAVAQSIPTSPSHGSLALYSTFSAPHQQVAHNPSNSFSEVSSPVFRGDGTLDRRQRTHLAKVEDMESHDDDHFCLAHQV